MFLFSKDAFNRPLYKYKNSFYKNITAAKKFSTLIKQEIFLG